MHRRSTGLLAIAVFTIIGLFLLAACSSDEADPTPAQPAQAPTSVPTSVPVSGSGVQGGDPRFDFTTMVSQGYWLSRDHFGPFVMASGAGIPFKPPMDMVQMAMPMVGQDPNDPVMVPQNMMPLQAVFASGVPKLANDPREFDPMDFEGLRVDPAAFDQRVTVRGQAYTMLKESQWAHNFASGHFGKPTDDFGAQQRFTGMMVSMLAQMQGQYAMQNLMGEDGLYHDSDGNLDYLGNWVMLHTLSDIAGLTGDSQGRDMNNDSHPMFENAANQLFKMLEARQAGSPQEAAAAIRALAYRVSTTEDDVIRNGAASKARSIADTLFTVDSNDVAETAAAVAGLVAAAQIEADAPYLTKARDLFNQLTKDFDAAHGVFKSKSEYDVDDVAWIIGGLNSLAQRADTDTKFAARRTLLAFYESAVALSGLQLSAPPGKNGAMAGQWEMDLPNVLYYHLEQTPPPPMAQRLPVPAERVEWDGVSWTVTSDRFVTAGAMHLSNELNWLGPHLGSIPFPNVNR